VEYTTNSYTYVIGRFRIYFFLFFLLPLCFIYKSHGQCSYSCVLEKQLEDCVVGIYRIKYAIIQYIPHSPFVLFIGHLLTHPFSVGTCFMMLVFNIVENVHYTTGVVWGYFFGIIVAEM